MQVLPLQQPLGQVVALQVPPEHAAPRQVLLPQGGNIPQRQAPSLEQLSALVELQVEQALPAAPHELNDGVLHEPEQQPLGHEVGLQATAMQLPPVHCSPIAHGGLPPHAHPPATQLSDRRPHPTQAVPPSPQAPTVAEVQTAP